MNLHSHVEIPGVSQQKKGGLLVAGQRKPQSTFRRFFHRGGRKSWATISPVSGEVLLVLDAIIISP